MDVKTVATDCGSPSQFRKNKTNRNTKCNIGKELSSLTQGQFVYIRDQLNGWVPAVVISTNPDKTTVTVGLEQGQQLTSKLTEVLLRPEAFDFVHCSRLTEVTPINEATVLDCLHQRFMSNKFYTLAGSTVVAVNPFKTVAGLYTMNNIWDYHNTTKKEKVLDPHVYMVASKAYSCMVRQLGKVDQGIVVSGESGAGKTVSAKHLLRYLTIVSSPEDEIDLNRSVAGSVIERRVLDSNPLLEAFGNAATPRNENSSRFGKYIQLQFHRNGRILGGNIDTYLLEKTRVVHQGEGENNFHIFYQLLSLQEEPHLPAWLEKIKAEVIHSRLECCLTTNAEKPSLLATVNAMTEIGISHESQAAIFQILLAILHLTTLKFLPVKEAESTVYSDDRATLRAKEECARLLGVSDEALRYVLLNRSIISGGGGCGSGEGRPARRSVYHKPVIVAEAEARRDCLAMLLYSKLFDWLVTFINHQIKVETFDHSINLLDIYGFEVFDINSLEQLCINYANERLQQHYVVHFLKDLQDEYRSEGVEWTSVNFTDNQQCVEVLDGPSGVFGVLNEDVYLNRHCGDHRVCCRVIDACNNPSLVRKPHSGTYGNQFFVTHYAGDVLYTAEEAVTKNKDAIPSELTSLLASSSNAFIINLFTEYTEHSDTSVPSPHKQAGKAKRSKTVISKFKSSLDSLMDSLCSTDVHYIRCIKPNTHNKCDTFDRAFVLHQLRACGTVQTIEICKRGYPVRMTYREFVCRYGSLLRMNHVMKSIMPEAKFRHIDLHAAGKHEQLDTVISDLISKVEERISKSNVSEGSKCAQVYEKTFTTDEDKLSSVGILVAVLGPENLVGVERQFGTSKIFLSQLQFEQLEDVRNYIIYTVTCKAQAWWKGRMQKTRYNRTKEAVVMIQASWRAYFQQQQYKRIRQAVITIQRSFGALRLRRSLKALSSASQTLKRSLTKWVRRVRFRKALHSLRKQKHEFKAGTCSTSKTMVESDLSPFKVQDSPAILTDITQIKRESLHNQNHRSRSMTNLLVHDEFDGFPSTSSSSNTLHKPATYKHRTESSCMSSSSSSRTVVNAFIDYTNIVDDDNISSDYLYSDSKTTEYSPELTSHSSNTIEEYCVSVNSTSVASCSVLTSIKTDCPNPTSLDHESVEHSVNEMSYSGLWSDDSGIISQQEMISDVGNNTTNVLSPDRDNNHNIGDVHEGRCDGPSPAKRLKVRRGQGDARRNFGGERKENIPGSSIYNVTRNTQPFAEMIGGGDGGPSKRSNRRGRTKEDLQIGNGVLTCRRLTKAGFRFHVRPSVLKYAHKAHQSYLPHGLPDALPDILTDDEQKKDASNKENRDFTI